MKLNCKRIDFTYTPGEEIFTFPDESGLPFLFDVEKELTADPTAMDAVGEMLDEAEKLAEKAKTAITWRQARSTATAWRVLPRALPLSAPRRSMPFISVWPRCVRALWRGWRKSRASRSTAAMPATTWRPSRSTWRAANPPRWQTPWPGATTSPPVRDFTARR